jgi:hypothetical protein
MKLIGQIGLNAGLVENEVWRKLKTKANLHDYIIREIEMKDIEALRDSLKPKYPPTFIPDFLQVNVPLKDVTNKPQEDL